MSEASRIAALKAAIALRTPACTPATIIDRARVFDDWIIEAASANPGAPVVEAGSGDTAKAPGEAAA